MRSRVLLGTAAATTLVVLAACSGLKDALTAHVDVVARAAGQELTVTRLGDLLGNATIPVQVTRDNTAIVANIWTGYEEIGYAAAHGDSLNDKKAIDAAIAPIIDNMKVDRFRDSIAKTFKVDSGSEAQYDQAAGGLLSARHILFAFPTPATASQKDSVRKKAASILPQVNAANFTAMADKYSGDPTVKQNHGFLGVFPKAQMMAAFSTATAALKPGEVSKTLTETPYGYHIIYRPTYAEVQKEFAQAYGQSAVQIAESTYMANLDSSAHIMVKPSAPAAIKAAVKDEPKYRNDHTTLATFNGGSLTTAEFLGWIDTRPPQQQIAQRIPQVPDSVLRPFLKELTEQQVMLQRANAAHIDLTPAERANFYSEFQQLVGNLWTALGVDPRLLADSAKNTPEKQKLAASRVDGYMTRMMVGQAQPLPVPPPLQHYLDDKYESSVNSAGVDRAFERANKVRQSADSARMANQPKSQVPLPGMGGPPAGQQQQPPAQQTQPAKPPTPNTKK